MCLHECVSVCLSGVLEISGFHGKGGEGILVPVYQHERVAMDSNETIIINP